METERRVYLLKQKMEKSHLEAIVTFDIHHLFYLTNLELSLGMMIITTEKSALFVDGRYRTHAQKHFPEEVLFFSWEEMQKFLQREKVQTLYFCAHQLTHQMFIDYQKALEPLKVDFCPGPDLIAQLRQIKSQEELKILEKAAFFNFSAYKHVCSLLKEGVTEKEIQLAYQEFCLSQGLRKLSFETIVCFGENSALPHHHSTDRALQKGDLVLLDMGVEFDHYQSDMTRVVFFGDVSAKLEKIYQIVYQAQKKAIDACKPQVLLQEVDQVARDYIDEKGYKDAFVHGLGHGVGLEVHESPRVNSQAKGALEEAMVITIEPGIYLAGIGGVRYEDTICITPDGHRNFYAEFS